MSRRFRNQLFLSAMLSIFLVLLMAVNTFAAVSVSLDIQANSIQVGEQVLFTIQVNGATNAPQPDVRHIAGLDIQHLESSRQISIINMQTTSNVIHRYVITGTKAGQYTLGPYTIRAGGKVIKTNSIRLTVGSPNGAGSSSQSNQNTQGSQNTQNDESETQGPLGDRVIVKLEIPKTTLYYGERIPAKIKVLYNIRMERMGFPVFEQSDSIVTEGFKSDIDNEEIVNGQQYFVKEFNGFIIPVQSGTLSVGPVKVVCAVVVGSNNDSILGSFFSETRQIAVNSKKITLKVLPLPDSDKPKDFSGGVGNFQFHVSAAPTEVLQGDPITVKMTVSGEGNLQTIAAPVIANKTGLKVYDAQRKTTEGQDSEISFEQVVIPLDPNVKQIGPFTLNFFNPATGRYQQLTQPAIPVTVKPNPNFKAEANWGSGDSNKNEQVGKDLVFIKDHPGALEPLNDRLDRKLWFWLLQLLPLLGLVGAFQYRKRLEFLQADTLHSRAVRASLAASRRLATIKALLAAGELDNFLEELHQTLRGYLGEKFKLAAAGMTGNVVEALKTQTIPEDTLAQIREFFSQYDFYRFTGAQLNQETAVKLTDLTVTIITALDRLQPGRTKNLQKSVERSGIHENQKS